jgi:hypothetical protein
VRQYVCGAERHSGERDDRRRAIEATSPTVMRRPRLRLSPRACE